jgi:NAD(P)-dependent dehydrogenase (short-subunit alcohol dehydrogenase family)
MDLTGTNAVVTGAASGIGESLARLLVDRGSRVAVVDISKESAQAVATAIGSGARGYGCDVSDPDQVAAMAGAVLADFGNINQVFANAGVAIGGKLTETSSADFRWLFDVNVLGVFETVKAFTPALLEQGSKGHLARFVLTGSENSVGLPPTAEMTAYTATKHAILALADGLRRDLRDAGVSAHVFCPGVVATRIFDARSRRQDRYGGSDPASADHASEMSERIRSVGQDPDVTARLCLEGIDRGEFIVITDPKIRGFAETRHSEVTAALDTLDRRLAETGLPATGPLAA